MWWLRWFCYISEGQKCLECAFHQYEQHFVDMNVQMLYQWNANWNWKDMRTGYGWKEKSSDFVNFSKGLYIKEQRDNIQTKPNKLIACR